MKRVKYKYSSELLTLSNIHLFFSLILRSIMPLFIPKYKLYFKNFK